MKRFIRFSLLSFVVWGGVFSNCKQPSPTVSFSSSPLFCHYSTWRWDTHNNQSVRYEKIIKLYKELTSEEKGSYPNCTVCEEDQELVLIQGLPSILVCKQQANFVRQALQAIQASGFPVRTLQGYRVGRSTGSVDAQGLRTQFGEHSFGIAIDINAQANGLYKNCVVWGTHCQLVHGGVWNPSSSESITKNSRAYHLLRKGGWVWGGEQTSTQKDFMHFFLRKPE